MKALLGQMREVNNTEDPRIIELYFNRDEEAIKETNAKYGNLCHSIAYNILNNHEDAEECVNDMNAERLHHEIYLSDARKVTPEKWKTVIRHPIKKL